MRPRRALLRGLTALALLLAASPISSSAAPPLFVDAGSEAAANPEPVASRSVRPPATEEPRVDHSAAAIGAETLGAPVLARPAQPAIEAVYVTAPVADHCVDRDLPALPAVDPVFTLLDRSYALPADYAPADLVSVADAGFAGDELLRSVVFPDLAALRQAAASAGIELIIESGYRSYEAQAATLAYWVGVEGAAAAALRAARPGHSEHQLGTAIDVTSAGWSGRVGDWAAESLEGAWMAAHAWEFGFVMSYPSGGEAVSCFGYEPWHYRWIGRDAARAHRDSGEPLRGLLIRYLAG